MKLDAGEIVSLLTRGIHASAVHYDRHPRVVEAASLLAERFAGSGDASRGEPFRVSIVDRRLTCEGRFLIGATLIAKRLVDAAIRMRSGGFVIHRDATAEEFIAFFSVCSGLGTNAENLEAAALQLRRSGVSSLELAPPASGSGLGDAGAVAWAEGLGRAVAEYQSMLETVETVHAAVEGGRTIDVNAARATVEGMVAGMRKRPANAMQFARYPDYDNYTVGHSVRVALLSLLVANTLTEDDDVLVEIGTAALLHDVGKCRVPDEILFKRGALDADERQQVCAHPVTGARILLETADASPLCVAAAFGHHLRHDGAGYPAACGLRGRVTALIQVCDVFEALTAIRPYKRARTAPRAYEIMMGDRGAFEPAALAAFVKAVGLFPPGSLVRLATGENAVVLRPGAHVARPVVELSHDGEGRLLGRSDAHVLDLGDPSVCGDRHVEGILLDDVLPAGHETRAPMHLDETSSVLCCPVARNLPATGDEAAVGVQAGTEECATEASAHF